MIEIPISFLQPGQITDQPYLSENGTILITRRTLLTVQDLAALKKKGINSVYVNGSSEDEELNKLLVTDFNEDIISSEASAPTEETIRPVNSQLKTKPGKEGLIELQKSPICAELDYCIADCAVDSKPTGSAFKNEATQIKAGPRSAQYKSTFLSNYDDARLKTTTILLDLAAGKDISIESVRSISSFMAKAFLTDRNILLNLSNIKPSDGDYLFHHVLNVCIISINIAAAYGYNETQVIEIGMGALLHDVGMLLIPDEIRFKKTRPVEDEWYEIQKHPLTGIHLLEKIRRLPESVMFVTYQSHERENGKGYPKQRSSRLIHNYAKIVAIADIFEALTSPRSYREALLPYKAMESLIKMTRQGLVSGEFVKALLEYTSLFPIGSIVELSNKCIGKVVQSHGTSFAKPSVCILIDANGTIIPENEQYIEDLTVNTSVQVIKTHESKQFDQNIMCGF